MLDFHLDGELETQGPNTVTDQIHLGRGGDPTPWWQVHGLGLALLL